MEYKFDLKKFNENYGKTCPCIILPPNSPLIEKFKCPCEVFRKTGICNCGLFKKTVEKSKDL